MIVLFDNVFTFRLLEEYDAPMR